MAATNLILLNFLLLLGVFHCQDVELRVYKGSFGNYVIVTLDKICDILPHIDKEKTTVFTTNGLGGSPTGPQVQALASALLDTQQYNVIFLDWSEESQVGPLGVSVTYVISAAPKAIKIGCEFGTKLAALVQCGLDSHKIYLIGHSLGAHMMGEAGRCALDNDILIPRITGLDPSGPLFQGLVKYPALEKASAYFVDVIHTDTGKYGSKTSMGTVDFYPNYKETNAKQPGCPDGNFEQLSPEDRCSHDRAVLLFCEGTRNPHTLMAAGAKNFDDWQKQNGTTDDINYIGPLTDFTVSGNYYLTTNSESLYSKGEEGLKPPSQ